VADERAAGSRRLVVPSANGDVVAKERAGPAVSRHAGGVRNPSNVQRGLRAVLDRIGGYGWVVPHTFRRTVETRLDDAGLSPRKIADHLGHAKPSMTMDVYLGRKVVPAEAAVVLRKAAA
jgi:integrase